MNHPIRSPIENKRPAQLREKEASSNTQMTSNPINLQNSFQLTRCHPISTILWHLMIDVAIATGSENVIMALSRSSSIRIRLGITSAFGPKRWNYGLKATDLYDRSIDSVFKFLLTPLSILRGHQLFPRLLFIISGCVAILQWQTLVKLMLSLDLVKLG